MYILLSKKKLAVILAVLVIALLLLGQFLSVKAYGVDLSTNEKRLQYISSLGLTLKTDDYQIKQTAIPLRFSDVYERYNSLQRSAGFDLKNYCGENVVIYTYNIDEQTVVNLITYKDKLIGGDIASLKIDGKMTALKGKHYGKGTL